MIPSHSQKKYICIPRNVFTVKDPNMFFLLLKFIADIALEVHMKYHPMDACKVLDAVSFGPYNVQ